MIKFILFFVIPTIVFLIMTLFIVLALIGAHELGQFHGSLWVKVGLGGVLSVGIFSTLLGSFYAGVKVYESILFTRNK